VRFGDSRTNRHIGYLPDVPEFYGYMTPKEYLALCGRIAGLNANELAERTDRLLELTGLKGVNRKIRGFSRGMKQRLGIARALINKPRILICDEPTSALDPVGRKEILDILAVARKDTTVVFSTHILSDVERICDRIGVVDKGRLVLSGTLSDIKDEYRRDAVRIELKTPEAAAALGEKIKALPRVTSVQVEAGAVEAAVKGVQKASAEILNLIAREGMFIQKFEILEPSLENVFLEAVK
jgi:ABC-2 type transport system ATP-binding protein